MPARANTTLALLITDCAGVFGLVTRESLPLYIKKMLWDETKLGWSVWPGHAGSFAVASKTHRMLWDEKKLGVLFADYRSDCCCF